MPNDYNVLDFKATGFSPFGFKCKMTIMPLILEQPASLHLKPNGEDTYTPTSL